MLRPPGNSELVSAGVSSFCPGAALKALAQTVKAKKKEAYDGALKQVQERLAEADVGLKAAEQNWARFSVETALEAIAADDFRAAQVKKLANLGQIGRAHV